MKLGGWASPWDQLIKIFLLAQCCLFGALTFANIFFIYRDVHKSGWQWRALRLLSKKSRHLFEQTQTPARKIPDYLEDIMRKLAKEITVCFNIY